MGHRLDPERLERLLEITRSLAGPFDLPTMLGRVVDAGRDVLDADRGTVFLYDAEREELHTAVATGIGDVRVPAGRGIVGECARTRQVVNVPDAYADARFNRDVDRRTGYRTESILAVPLIGHDDALVGVLQLLNRRGGPFGADDEDVASALGAQCAVALQRVRMIEALVDRERLAHELDVARQIQMGILPVGAPAPPGYELAGTSRPADETGGDVFDFAPIDEQRLALLLGDATGHGVGPALTVTQMRSMLRISLRLGAALDDAVQQINDQLADDLPDNRMVTAFIGVLDSAVHSLTYHAAGQAPLLHWHASDDRFEWLNATTMPLGFLSGVAPRPSATVRLEPGDLVGLITDGAYEAEDLAGEEFGTAGVERALRRQRGAPIGAQVQALLDEVDAHRAGGRQLDDITIVLLRRQPA